MSFFESVWVKLACQRCGKVHNTIVRLDDERRIVVTDMQGRRLTRDGARLEQ